MAESRMTGKPGPPFEWKQLLKDVVRAVRINLRNLLRMVILIGLSWLLVLIPLLGSMASAALIFFIQAFYNGFALSDYTLERKRLSVKESVQFGKDHRARVVGVGAGFMAMMLVPIVGWFAAPTYGAVAATIASMGEVGEGNLPAADGAVQNS
jgi:CysZ protein